MNKQLCFDHNGVKVSFGIIRNRTPICYEKFECPELVDLDEWRKYRMPTISEFASFRNYSMRYSQIAAKYGNISIVDSIEILLPPSNTQFQKKVLVKTLVVPDNGDPMYLAEMYYRDYWEMTKKNSFLVIPIDQVPKD